MVSTTENMLLIGAGFLVIACVFFLLFGFVFAIKLPTSGKVFKPLTFNGAEESTETVEATSPVSDYSFLWIGLLVLSMVVMLIGAKLVFSSYTRKAL